MLKWLKIVVTYHAGYFGWLVCGLLAGWCVTHHPANNFMRGSFVQMIGSTELTRSPALYQRAVLTSVCEVAHFFGCTTLWRKWFDPCLPGLTDYTGKMYTLVSHPQSATRSFWAGHCRWRSFCYSSEPEATSSHINLRRWISTQNIKFQLSYLHFNIIIILFLFLHWGFPNKMYTFLIFNCTIRVISVWLARYIVTNLSLFVTHIMQSWEKSFGLI
jgi:hypothetical protein